MLRTDDFDLVWECSLVALTAAGLLVISVLLIGSVLLLRHFSRKPPFVAIGRSVQPILAIGESTSSNLRQLSGRIFVLVPVAIFLGLAAILAWG